MSGLAKCGSKSLRLVSVKMLNTMISAKDVRGKLNVLTQGLPPAVYWKYLTVQTCPFYQSTKSFMEKIQHSFIYFYGIV